MVFLMKIQQQPSNDFCVVKYSKVPKRGGAIIRRGAIFRGNTVFRTGVTMQMGNGRSCFKHFTQFSLDGSAFFGLLFLP